MKYLITGGCGFLGSNLADAAMQRGDDVTLLDNLSRAGSEKNRAWLETRGRHEFVHADVRHAEIVSDLVNRLQRVALRLARIELQTRIDRALRLAKASRPNVK